MYRQIAKRSTQVGRPRALLWLVKVAFAGTMVQLHSESRQQAPGCTGGGTIILHRNPGGIRANWDPLRKQRMLILRSKVHILAPKTPDGDIDQVCLLRPAC